MSSSNYAKLDVSRTYTSYAELAGWLGSLSQDVSNGAIAGFNISTREIGGVKRIAGEVTVVIPSDHLSTVVEDPE